MHHVWVSEHANDLADRIGFTNVGQELVAQPSAFAGALDDASNVHKFHGCGEFALRTKNPCQSAQALIRHSHDADVGFDGGEGVISRQHIVFRQRIKQGGFAHVRQADNADLKGHAHQSRWRI